MLAFRWVQTVEHSLGPCLGEWIAVVRRCWYQKTSRNVGCSCYIDFIDFPVIFTKAESGSLKARSSSYHVGFFFLILWLQPWSSVFSILCVATHFLCCFQVTITVIGLCPTRITASSCTVTSWACARMLANKTSEICLEVTLCFRLLLNPGSWSFCFKCLHLDLDWLSAERDRLWNACRVIP